MRRTREFIPLSEKLKRTKTNDYREKKPFTKPQLDGSRYDNPTTWHYWRKFGLFDLILWKFNWRPQSERAHNLKLQEDMDKLNVKTPYGLEAYKNADMDTDEILKRVKAKIEDGNIRATWLGHASVLVQFPGGLNCLLDPVFSNRASPVQFIGPKRNTKVPFTVDQLKSHKINIDLIVISHNHYDHLDMNTINEFRSAYPEIMYYVPTNTNKETMHINEAGLCFEMDWWDEKTQDFEFPNGRKLNYKVTNSQKMTV